MQTRALLANISAASTLYGSVAAVVLVAWSYKKQKTSTEKSIYLRFRLSSIIDRCHNYFFKKNLNEVSKFSPEKSQEASPLQGWVDLGLGLSESCSFSLGRDTFRHAKESVNSKRGLQSLFRLSLILMEKVLSHGLSWAMGSLLWWIGPLIEWKNIIYIN